MKVDLKPRFNLIDIQYLIREAEHEVEDIDAVKLDICGYDFVILNDGKVFFEKNCIARSSRRKASKEEVRLVINILEYALRKIKERYGIGD